MNGRGLSGTQLPQTLGRPAGGGGQGSLQPHGLEQGQHAPQAGGLSGARSAGEQHHLPLGRLSHRLELLGRVGDPLGPLDLLQQAVQPLRGQKLRPAHLAHPLGDVGLRLIQGREIDRLLSRYLVQVHLAPDGQGVQTLLQRSLLALQQLGGGPHQLLGGEKGVAVVPVVVGQLKQQAGLQTLGIVRRHTQREGQGVRLGEVNPELPCRQDIGVGAHHLQGHVAIGPEQAAGQLHGQLMLRQELQQAAHSHLLPEGLADGPGSLGGHPPQPGKLLRFLLHDPQGVLAELLDEQAGGGLAHSLHRTGGQVVVDLLQPLGQAALHHIRPKLDAVGGVAHPLPPDSEVLPGGHPGHGANHSHLLLTYIQAQDGIAVFLVMKDQRGDRPLQYRQFRALLRHGDRSSLFLSLCPGCCGFLRGLAPLVVRFCRDFALRGGAPGRRALRASWSMKGGRPSVAARSPLRDVSPVIP